MQLTTAQKALLSEADKMLGRSAAVMIFAVEVVCNVSREVACVTVAHLLADMAALLIDAGLPVEDMPAPPKGDAN